MKASPEAIRVSIYLVFHNPWEFAPYIEWNMEKAIEAEFFQMYKEICLIYASGLNRSEESFQWYFEDVFEKRIIDPNIETKKYGPGGRGIADWFVEGRKKDHEENMNDYRKIYSLWKKVGINRGFDILHYPDQLEDIFN